MAQQCQGRCGEVQAIATAATGLACFIFRFLRRPLADLLGVKQIIHGHHHNPFIYSDPRYVNVGFRGFYEVDT